MHYHVCVVFKDHVSKFGFYLQSNKPLYLTRSFMIPCYYEVIITIFRYGTRLLCLFHRYLKLSHKNLREFH